MTGTPMRGRSVSELLALPVRLHGIELGRPVDAFVDPTGERLLGFEILCGDGAHRFVPMVVVRLERDELAVESALTLIDERDLDFYRSRSRRLAELPHGDPRIDEQGRILPAPVAQSV
jgi:hypothetical protein